MQFRTLGLLISLTFFAACDRLSIPGQAAPAPAGLETVQGFLATPDPLAPYQTGAAYEVQGVRYEPRENFAYAVNGVASVYALSVEGALTASGETYRGSHLTAAHPTLPFQTIVSVRRLDNGQAVTVRINDRGPFTLGRVIDLSLSLIHI